MHSLFEYASYYGLCAASADKTDGCLFVFNCESGIIIWRFEKPSSGGQLVKTARFFSQFESLPFDDVALEQYGNIRVQLEEKGTPIGPHDLMIAAIAKAWNLILVTHNIAEFDRVKGLHIENWR